MVIRPFRGGSQQYTSHQGDLWPFDHMGLVVSNTTVTIVIFGNSTIGVDNGQPLWVDNGRPLWVDNGRPLWVDNGWSLWVDNGQPLWVG